MTTLRTFASLFLLLFVTAGNLSAQRLRGQAVNYANFNFVYSVATSMNYAYFATTGGIIRYDKINQRWDQPLTGAEGLINEYPDRIWVDHFDRNLFASLTTGPTGFYEYDFFFERWLPVAELPRIDNTDRHVVAPEVLLPTFDANYMGQGRFIDIHGRSFAVSDIVDDGSGTLWIGTWGFGAAQAGLASTLMELLPYGLLQKSVNVIVPDDTVLWVGGAILDDYRTGLTAFNPEENRFFYVETDVDNGLPADDITCLETGDRQVFVGTPAGIYTLDRETWTAKGRVSRRHGLLDDYILSLFACGDSLFVGTAGGLSLIDLATDSVYSVKPSTFFNQAIFDLEPVASDLWIASSEGAYRLSLETGRLQQYRDPEAVLFGGVSDIEQFGDLIWFASRTGVVSLNLNTGRSTAFRDILDYLGRALAVNGAVAAFSSNNGMTLLFWNQEKPYAREFTIEDGLALGSVSSLLLDGDYLWIGSDAGLTRFWWNNPHRVD